MKSKQISEFKETEIGKISTEFEVMKLGQMLKLLKDGSHNPPKRVPDGIPFIAGATEITYFDIDFSKATYITKEEYDKIHKNFEVIENDILLTIVGTVGNVAIVKKSDLPFSLQRNIAILRPNEHLHHLYLFYWLSSPLFKNILHTWGNRTAQPRFYLGQISDTPIVLPSLEIQKKISSFLLNIDLKIKNLEQQNKILEQIAHTIFKSWFVDFDGVTEFEDSELGKIPKGWKIEKLIDKIHVTYGFPFNSELFNLKQGKPVIRIRNLENSFSDTLTIEECDQKYHVSSGDILVGMDGEFNTHIWLGGDSLLNQRVCKLIPKSKSFNNFFILFSVKQKLKDYEQKISGTTVIHLSKSDIEDLKLIFPNDLLLEKYTNLTNPLFQQLIKNQHKLRISANLKDILLPKLLSGEIRV